MKRIKLKCVFLGFAGFWVSINRIITKSLLNDERGNTSMFFILSNMTILLCFVLNIVVQKTDFVQFYITLCQERNRITLEPTEDVGLVRKHNRAFFIDLCETSIGKFRNKVNKRTTESSMCNRYFVCSNVIISPLTQSRFR